MDSRRRRVKERPPTGKSKYQKKRPLEGRKAENKTESDARLVVESATADQIKPRPCDFQKRKQTQNRLGSVSPLVEKKNV